jgi:hypothetical protein
MLPIIGIKKMNVILHFLLVERIMTTFQLKYPFSDHIDKLNWESLSENPNIFEEVSNYILK